MKLSILSLVVASIGVANATPMRIVYVNDAPVSGNVAAVVRPLPAALNGAVVAHPHVQPIPIVAGKPIVQGGVVVIPGPIPVANMPSHMHGHSGKPGCAARLRQKATGLAQSIKIAFGFSVHKAAKLEVNGKTPGGDSLHIVHVASFNGVNVNEPHHHHAHHRPHHLAMGGLHHERPAFLTRVHYALMSLGPWEGRAVAFVLGCGIGVLLRMAWVLVVLAFRAVRSPSSQEHAETDYYYAGLEAEGDAEELFVAPPMYTVPVAVPVDAQGFPVEKVEEESK